MRFNKISNPVSALVLLSCLLAQGFAPALALALDQLTVQDTTGVTRAVGDIDGTGRVEFSLSESAGVPADGVEVTLTNTSSGEVLSATSANGSVAFDGISSGTWTVATNSPGITFSNVVIASTQALGAALGISTPLVLGVAAAGGITATSIAVANNNNNDDSPPLSPAS